MTAFFGVHLVLVIVSLTLGTIIGSARTDPTSVWHHVTNLAVAGSSMTWSVLTSLDQA